MRKALAALMAAVVLGPPAAHGESSSNSTYLGEYCWEAVSSQGEMMALKVGITLMGGGGYMVIGTGTNVDAGANGNVGGSLKQVDTRLRGVLTAVYTHDNHVESDTMSLDLDPTTLDGQYKAVRTVVLPGVTTTESEHEAGILRPVACQ